MAHWSGIGIPKTNAIALEVSYTHMVVVVVTMPEALLVVFIVSVASVVYIIVVVDTPVSSSLIMVVRRTIRKMLGIIGLVTRLSCWWWRWWRQSCNSVIFIAPIVSASDICRSLSTVVSIFTCIPFFVLCIFLIFLLLLFR